jgi:hypothetical protein
MECKNYKGYDGQIIKQADVNLLKPYPLECLITDKNN